MSIPISKKEELAVRFYMGDPKIVEMGIYRGGCEAYNTINALLHPGIYNERDKAREGRRFGLIDVDHLKSYLDVITDVYSAMVNYRDYAMHNNRKREWSYRIDRASSLAHFIGNDNMVSGFFSTCKRGFLPEYAHAKAEIVMLEIECDENVPWLDFEDIFGTKYAKPEEAEILLPFGMVIADGWELDISELEKAEFLDIRGHAPVAKWHLCMKEPEKTELTSESMEVLYKEITEERIASRAIKIMERLCKGEAISVSDEAFYGQWKQRIRRYNILDLRKN